MLALLFSNDRDAIITFTPNRQAPNSDCNQDLKTRKNAMIHIPQL